MNFLKTIFLLLSFFLSCLEAQPLESVTLQLQWKHQFEFAGFYAAKEQGYYEEAGLDVHFREPDPFTNITKMVLDGNATYGVSYSSLIAEYLEGAPVVLLANFFKQSPLVVVAQPELKTPADLRGKRVMGPSNSVHNITLMNMLSKFNVSLDDIVHVENSFNVDAFINKKIDAMSVFTTNELYTLDKKGVKYTLFDPVSYGSKYYDVNLFTSKKELRVHPLRTKRFRDASIKGWKYALEHQNIMVDLIFEKYNTQRKTKEALRFEAKQIAYLMLPQVYDVGSVSIARIKMIAESFIQEGLIKKVINRDLEALLYEYDHNPLGLTEDEKSFIKRHPTLILGSDSAQKPLILYDAKAMTIRGYDRDVLDLISEVSELRFQIEPMDHAQINFKLKADEIDGVSVVDIKKHEYAPLHDTNSYITMPSILFSTKNSSKTVKSLQDLSGKRIGISQGRPLEEKTLSNLKASHIVYYDTRKEMIKSLHNGAIDAIIDGRELFYYAKMVGDVNISRAFLVEEGHGLVFGIKKETQEAVNIINKSLAYIGRYKLLELQKKWFDGKEAIDNRDDNIGLSTQEEAYLKEKKRITLCVDPDWMPFEQIERGQYQGLSSAYIKHISKLISTPIVLIPTDSWESSLKKARERTCDILSMFAETEKNRKYWNFTTSYINTTLVMVTHKDELYIDDLASYKNKKWGIVKSYAIKELLLQNYPEINLIEVDSLREGLKEVEHDKLFGVIDNAMTVSYALQRELFDTLAITGRLDNKVHYAMASRNDEPLLHEILEKAVLHSTPYLQNKLLPKWINNRVVSKVDYTLLWQFIVLSIVILLLMFYKNFLLNREIGKRLKIEEKLKQTTVQLEEMVKNEVKKVEEKNITVSESRYNFENIFNITLEMLLFFEEDGTILDINQSGLNMLGFDYKSEVVGSKLLDYIGKKEWASLENLSKVEHNEAFELIIMTKAGREVEVLVKIRRAVQKAKEVRMLSVVDLTEVRQKNKQLIQQSKMAAMGEMIEHIAHQWRQPLSQVNSAVLVVDALLERHGLEDTQIEFKLSEIESLTKYMSMTINDFKNFFIEDKKKIFFRLKDVINYVVDIAWFSLNNKDISLSVHVDDNINMRNYANELQQVILVLINNARDVLEIEQVEDPKIVIDVESSAHYVTIKVSDNAGGIDESILDKVFDPYFTTKQATNGTGLGLYISKMIIEESMEGNLSVKNSDKGAEFSIVLPYNI